MATTNTKDDVGLTMLLVMMYRAGLEEVIATEDQISEAVNYYKSRGQAFLVDDNGDDGLQIKMISKEHLDMLAEGVDEDNLPDKGVVIN